jgi:RNA polymerase sigma-70 factor (ECF subfamily)
MDPMMFENAPERPITASGRSIAGGQVPGSKPLTLAALFESEESPLLHFAVGIVRRRSVAEDLVQEAFLRLSKVWDQVDNPRGWLYRSVRNLALNQLRDARPEAPLEGETPAADQPLPAELLGRSEAIGTVRMLLAEIPAEDRALIGLKFNENLKYEEISRRTGMSVGNVGFRLHHVLKDLLNGLQRAGIGGSQG